MRSGQINILNKLGCVISTKYPTAQNPLEEMVGYSKQVLDGIQNDETWFALLFEPDKTENWMNDDLILKHANPASHEIPEIWKDLVKKRAYAIIQESARENFLTKIAISYIKAWEPKALLTSKIFRSAVSTKLIGTEEKHISALTFQ
jgi:phage terminase large subunit-like protein